MMPLNHATPAFEKRYASHLKHLKLQGLQLKTVDAYARAMGEHFDWQVDTLRADQLTNYFHQRIAAYSVPMLRLGDGDRAPTHHNPGTPEWHGRAALCGAKGTHPLNRQPTHTTGHRHAHECGGGARSKNRHLQPAALAVRAGAASNAVCISPYALPGRQHRPNF